MRLSSLVARSLDTAAIAFGAKADAIPIRQLIEATDALFGDAARSDAIGAVLTNDRPSVELVLGAILHGAKLVSLPLPGHRTNVADYAAALTALCNDHSIAEVVARDDVCALFPNGQPVWRPHSQLHSAPIARPTHTFTLVQHTSGTIRRPRPIMVDDIVLGANVDALLDALQPRDGDRPVSWLPLSHDMGLTGMLLTSIAAMCPEYAGQSSLTLLEPDSFLRRPAVWFEVIAERGGTFTAAPDFGYRFATRYPPVRADIRTLRCAIVGGEIVRAQTLKQFTDTFASYGLRPTALCPAYGMAELGVAATLTRPDELWRSRSVSADGLAEGRLASPRCSTDELVLISSGTPLRGYEISCTSNAVTPISVRGPSIGRNEHGIPLVGANGAYATDDVGFIDDGHLYVCGRSDDYVVVHGRNVFAPHVEEVVATVRGVRAGRAVALGLPNGGFAVLVEADPHAHLPLDVLRRDVRRQCVSACGARPDDVFIVEKRGLPVTASGKLRRGEALRLLLADELPMRR